MLKFLKEFLWYYGAENTPEGQEKDASVTVGTVKMSEDEEQGQ